MSNITMPPATEPTAGRPLKILLAEDNITNQKLAVAILQKQGNHVTVAGDGRQAVDYFERESFDLVLMDMQMPELDGLEATAAILQNAQDTGVYIMERLRQMQTRHNCIGDVRGRGLMIGVDLWKTHARTSRPQRWQSAWSSWRSSTACCC